MKLTLINHACVKLESGAVGILMDPWLEGTAFNDGWSLLVPTPLSTEEVMRGISHVWLSHEHPDHFSPRFLSQIAKTHAASVTVLFRQTRDGRVKKFCAAKGFKVIEVGPREVVSLGDGVEARIGPSGTYDSWLSVRDRTASLLNLNDCVISDEAELAQLRAAVGEPDVLLTQFSYAAWKGGRENRSFRESAARDKLRSIDAQARVLRAKNTIPFASLVYFSSVENNYLNDSVNRPDQAAAAIQAAGSNAILLYPGDEWTVGAPHSNAEAAARYNRLYDGMSRLPLVPLTPSIALDELERRFGVYQKKLFEKNQKVLMGLARRVPLVGAFRPVTIRLSDLDKTVSVSPVDGFAVLAAPDHEVSMHSSSLAFIFDNDFGFDTLTVNGRFESTPQGFSKMARSFGIGSLNAMGVTLSWGMLRHAGVLAGMFRSLIGVTLRLRTARHEEVAPTAR